MALAGASLFIVISAMPTSTAITLLPQPARIYIEEIRLEPLVVTYGNPSDLSIKVTSQGGGIDVKCRVVVNGSQLFLVTPFEQSSEAIRAGYSVTLRFKVNALVPEASDMLTIYLFREYGILEDQSQVYYGDLVEKQTITVSSVKPPPTFWEQYGVYLVALSMILSVGTLVVVFSRHQPRVGSILSTGRL